MHTHKHTHTLSHTCSSVAIELDAWTVLLTPAHHNHESPSSTFNCTLTHTLANRHTRTRAHTMSWEAQNGTCVCSQRTAVVFRRWWRCYTHNIKNSTFVQKVFRFNAEELGLSSIYKHAHSHKNVVLQKWWCLFASAYTDTQTCTRTHALKPGCEWSLIPSTLMRHHKTLLQHYL